MDFKKQLIDAYSYDAQTRNDTVGTQDPWKLTVRQQFVDLLKAENKQSILEIGAGVGYDAAYFQDQGFDVMATDISEEMIQMCKKRGIEARTLDLYNLSKLNRTFDGIYSLNVLLHVPRKDLQEVLATIAQSLHDGGIFFYGVYGGYDKEQVITVDSKINLPRFFSLMSDETLKNEVRARFDIIDFKKIDIISKDPDLYFQSVFLRKK